MLRGMITCTYLICVANFPTSSKIMFCSGLVVGLIILFFASLKRSDGGCGKAEVTWYWMMLMKRMM